MPSAGESNRTGRETRQRVLTERAQGHHATLHKQRSSSSRPNTSQGDNSERSLPGFGNDASNAGDTSDKNNGGTESHEQSAELDLERIAEESFRAKDAKSRKKYPELREPCTYNKELCRAALKAMGYKNVSRLKAEGKDGKRMLQEYVSDEWRANPKMRRVGIRAVAAFEKMEYETSDSEEEEEDAHEEDDVAVCEGVPRPFAVKKLAGLVMLKGRAEATKNTYLYAAGQKYLTADVVDQLFPPFLGSARDGVVDLLLPSFLASAREPAPKSPPSQASGGKKRAAATQPKNGVVRLLNCLFMEDTRKVWEASKLQAPRTQLDSQEVGGILSFWNYVRDKVMDPTTKVGPLLPEPEGYNLLDGLDPEILDLPADTTGKNLKHMYKRQRRHYNAAKASFDKSGSNENQFASFVGTRAGAWYLYLLLGECPNMDGFCTAIMEKEVVEAYVASDSDNIAPSSALHPTGSSSSPTKKAKTAPEAAIANLGEAPSSGVTNAGGGIAEAAAARSANETVEIARMQATNRAMTLDNMERKHTMLQKLWDLSDSIQDKIPGACDDRQRDRLALRLKAVERQIDELSGL